MNIIKFSDFKRRGQSYLGLVEQGVEDFKVIDKELRDLPDGVTVLLDISGYDLFGYSYSKQTIRKALLRAKAGDYGRKFFLIYAPSKEYCEELSVALREAKLAMIGSTNRSSRKFYTSYFILGELSEPHKVTLDYIVKQRVTTSGLLKKDFGLESFQTASNRIKHLAKERLVRWEESPKRQRNVFDCSRLEL